MTTTGRGNRVAAAPKFNITTAFANRKAYVAGVVAMVKALHIGRPRETDMFSFFLFRSVYRFCQDRLGTDVRER